MEQMEMKRRTDWEKIAYEVGKAASGVIGGAISGLLCGKSGSGTNTNSNKKDQSPNQNGMNNTVTYNNFSTGSDSTVTKMDSLRYSDGSM